MSTSTVRVIARVRPLLKTEIEHDKIIETCSSPTSAAHKSHSETGQPVGPSDTIKIPNPKNPGEKYSFQFQSVYDSEATQQEIFEKEVSSTVKPLFTSPNGHALTLFAYGSTGTGKTFTMRGGKDLKSRGVIPRLLSSIYRRAKKMEKDDASGETSVVVSMSYYEIYNDKVFDLFDDAIDKRPPAGLPVREVEGGRTVVVGLREEEVATLKEFEEWYDKGNGNRRTGATKLNASSSRSHAVLCVKIIITNAEGTRVSTASAIDLAGSEDNRRTGNGKEALVESASINKSLFVLAQCVEAISKKQARIPYRESKMTRILSLGQNGGVTVMFLNLAPTKSFHLDTLSSLNFANRTKKIEVREVENEIMFKGPPRAALGSSLGISGTAAQRQPLRPLAAGLNLNIGMASTKDEKKGTEKPAKAFSVYSDRSKPRTSGPNGTSARATAPVKKSSPLKRGSGTFASQAARPSKMMRPIGHQSQSQFSKASIEEMVEKKVSEILAAKALESKPEPPAKEISEEVQRRLDSLEQRLEGQEGSRAEGLSYLLMAKQHQARGEDSSALKMYQLALPYFPGNEKLLRKIESTQERIQAAKMERDTSIPESQSTYASHDDLVRQKLTARPLNVAPRQKPRAQSPPRAYHDEDYEDYRPSDAAEEDYDSDASFQFKSSKAKKPRKLSKKTASAFPSSFDDLNLTPRTAHLLDIINTRDISQIKLLRGVGIKRAEAIVKGLIELDEDEERPATLRTLGDLGSLRGVGVKCVEGMRGGIEV